MVLPKYDCYNWPLNFFCSAEKKKKKKEILYKKKYIMDN